MNKISCFDFTGSDDLLQEKDTVPNTQIAVDVEDLMNRIQHRVDAHPDSIAMLDSIDELRQYADGICELNNFRTGLASGTKAFIYKRLMRALKGNFERQRLFNQALVNSLELIAVDLDKIKRRLPANTDSSTRPIHK